MEYVEIARAESDRGELVLRERRDDGASPVLELRANGVFVMDSAETTSEVALAAAALELVAEPRDVLVGGLGLGFTLQAVLSDAARRALRGRRDRAGARRTGCATAPSRTARPCSPTSGPSSWSPTSRSPWPRRARRPTTCVLLDVDNGPGYLVHETNAALYDAPFLALTRRVLRPGGALAIWSAAEAPGPRVGAARGVRQRRAADLRRRPPGPRGDLLALRRAGEHAAVVVGLGRVVVVPDHRRDVAPRSRRRPAGRGSSPSPGPTFSAISGSSITCAKVSVVTPSRSARSSSRRQTKSLPGNCVPQREAARRLARVDLVGLGLVAVRALGGHPEVDLARRGIAGPGADPALEPGRLGHRRPDVLDRRAGTCACRRRSSSRRGTRACRWVRCSSGLLLVVGARVDVGGRARCGVPRGRGRRGPSRRSARPARGPPASPGRRCEPLARAAGSGAPARAVPTPRGRPRRARRRCRLIAGRLIGWPAARSTTRAGPAASRTSRSRRTGSASASNASIPI